MRRCDSDHGEQVEIGTDALAGLRAHGEPGTSHSWNRYAFRDARVLVDKLDGEIGSIVERKRVLSDGAGHAIVRDAFDAYVNITPSLARGAPARRAAGSRMDACDA